MSPSNLSTVLLALMFTSESYAFLNTIRSTCPIKSFYSQLQMGYDLVAEPEGGEEMKAVNTMPGSRLKNMGKVSDIQDDEGSVFEFWLAAEADGTIIKENRIQVERDASKNANFPGFRKGQIPPYAQPQMTMFAIQETIIKTCETVVSAYGLKALSGSDGSVEVHEDIKDICKGYKIGNSAQFTATFKAIFDPDQEQENPMVEETEDEVKQD